jgi:hypothetical protein
MSIRGSFAVGAVVIGALALAPAAPAAIFYYASGDSVNAGTQGTVEASCGVGRALGGGVFSQGLYGTTNINSSVPDDGADGDLLPNDGWIAFVDGISGVIVSASVACVDGKPGDALKFRTTERSVGSGKTKELVASCPDRYKVTGGGVSNTGGFEDVFLRSSRPVSKGIAWEGEVKNVDDSAVTMTVHAICSKGRFARDLDYPKGRGKAKAGQQGFKKVGCGGGKSVAGGIRVGKGSFLVNGFGLVNDGTGAQAFVDATGSNAVRFKVYAVCRG